MRGKREGGTKDFKATDTLPPQMWMFGASGASGDSPGQEPTIVVTTGCYGNKGCAQGSEHGSRGLCGSKIGPSRSISFSTSLEGTTPVCEDIGRSLLTYGRRIPLAEWESRIEVIGALEEGLEP